METADQYTGGCHPFSLCTRLPGVLTGLGKDLYFMCGIIGYTGPLEAGNILLNGLAGLEYRGYDSAGIAYFGNDSKIHLIKTVGKVAALKELVKQESDCSSHCGIGHTRWATHGGVTTENAHPHRQGLVTLIHNGIIENYHQLTEEYDLEGHLLSQTDSEVAAGVLNALYERMDHDPLLSIRHFVKELKGSYGFCIMFEDRPGEIYAVQQRKPSCSGLYTLRSYDRI